MCSLKTRRNFINLSSHWHEHRRIDVMMNKCHSASSGFRGFAFGEHFKNQRSLPICHFHRQSTESHIHRRGVRFVKKSGHREKEKDIKVTCPR